MMKMIKINFSKRSLILVDLETGECFEKNDLKELKGEFFVMSIRQSMKFLKNKLFEEGYKGTTEKPKENEFMIVQTNLDYYSLKTTKFTIFSFDKMLPNVSLPKIDKDENIAILKALLKKEDFGLSGGTIASAVRKKWMSDFDGGRKVKGKRYNTKLFTDDMKFYVNQSKKGALNIYNEKYENVEVMDTLTFDVNSLYPSVALNELLPNGKPEFVDYNDFLEGRTKYDIAIIKVIIDAKSIYNPWFSIDDGDELLSYPEHIDNKIVFIWNFELEMLKKTYDIKQLTILSCLAFQGCRGDFDSFINFYKEKKEESNDYLSRYMSKMCLNNFLGKFGTFPLIEFYYEKEKGKFEFYTKETNDYYMALWSAVCAYGRVKMASKICFIIEKDDFVYCDTDSITCKNGEFYKEFLELDDVEFGKFKIESVNKKIKVIGQKKYIKVFNDGTSKSVIAGYSKQVSEKDFFKGNVIYQNLILLDEEEPKVQKIQFKI